MRATGSMLPSGVAEQWRASGRSRMRTWVLAACALLCACTEKPASAPASHDVESASKPPLSAAAQAYVRSLPPVGKHFEDGCDEVSSGDAAHSVFIRIKKGMDQRNARDIPDLDDVYDQYRCGNFKPEEAATYEFWVQTGRIMLRPTQPLRDEPPTPIVPDGVLKAYNQDRLPQEDRERLLSALNSGERSLPRGAAFRDFN